jgi:hypothetical protein
MNEFTMIFRSNGAPEVTLTPEQGQAQMKAWGDWMGGMAAQNKLASPGNRLGPEGSVLKSATVVTDGPYAETKEVIGGYIVVRAADIAEAVELAKGCPMIIGGGGTVEVRSIIPMQM